MKTTKPVTAKPVMIPLAQIENRFDVRVVLDQDRVIQFAGMYEASVELPPVRLVRLDEDTYAFIDGRTRAAARAYLNLPDVQAVIENGSLSNDPVELFAKALEANWGGSKPPTRDDITHTVIRMLEAGASRSLVYKRLSFLPSGAARGYLANALSILSKRKIAKALDAMSEGTTIEIAAKRNKLHLDVLKQIVSGKKGKWGQSRSDEVQLATEIKSYISRELARANKGIGGKLTDIFSKVESGEVSYKVAHSIIKSWYEHLRQTSLRVKDWQQRLDNISREQDKAVGEGDQEPVAEPVEPTPEQKPAVLAGRVPPGFWETQLPMAISATRQTTAEPLLRFFERHGHTFTLNQVHCALQRARKKGLKGVA